MRLEYLDPGASAEDVCEVLARCGAAIVRDLAPVSLIDDLLGETQPYFDAAPRGQDEFRGYRTRRVGALAGRSASFRALALSPLALGVAEIVLRPFCARIQLTYTQAIRLGPGESAQPLHRDDEVYPMTKPQGGEWAIILMWAASDFSAENGATRVVPGSHLWPRDRVARSDETMPAIMSRGSLLVHYGSVLHGGGANAASEDRVGVSVNYGLGWVRQIENQCLAVPPELARSLPPRLQDLLGYAVHGRLLGEVGLEDPRVAVLGASLDEVRAYEEARQTDVRRTTLSGYA